MPNHEFLGKKGAQAYDWMTYAQVESEAKRFAAGCMKLDLIPEVEGEGRKWRFIGLQSKNRREWGIAHIGNFHNNCTSVALYDTLGVEASKYVIQQTGLTTICCQGDLVSRIIDMKIEDSKAEPENQQIAQFKNIVSFDALDREASKRKDEAGLTVYQYEEVLQAGDQNPNWQITEPGPFDCPMFSYTSGTTGDPKGVKLTHQMLMSCATSVQLVAGLTP